MDTLRRAMRMCQCQYAVGVNTAEKVMNPDSPDLVS